MRCLLCYEMRDGERLRVELGVLRAEPLETSFGRGAAVCPDGEGHILRVLSRQHHDFDSISGIAGTVFSALKPSSSVLVCIQLVCLVLEARSAPTHSGQTEDMSWDDRILHVSLPLFAECNLALVSAHAPTVDRAPRVDEYWPGTCGICGGSCKSAVTMLPHHSVWECGREARGPSDHVLGVSSAVNRCMYVCAYMSDAVWTACGGFVGVGTGFCQHQRSPLCHSRTILLRLAPAWRERRNTAARQTERVRAGTRSVRRMR